ncbi:MAG: MgtC/SapB family protein, partial [Actinobacteria bacterium]|nr:MgtC/SapB family protein [Actinomycetota bacterium]
VGVLAAHGVADALNGALTGVGFIGAVLVFRQEHSDIVHGLTTAASILAGVAVGAAAGEGRLLLATVAAAVTVLILEMRYVPALRVLDGRRWASRFAHDELPRSERAESGSAGPAGSAGPGDGRPGPDRGA